MVLAASRARSKPGLLRRTPSISVMPLMHSRKSSVIMVRRCSSSTLTPRLSSSVTAKTVSSR